MVQLLTPQETLLLLSSQAVRRGGARSTLLYNTIGKAQWEVLQLDASVAAGGGLARRVSLLDRQGRAQPQLRTSAHGVQGTPVGGSAGQAGLPGQQTGAQLRTGVHGVHEAPVVADARQQSLPDQQAGQQLRTGERGESVSVQAGHASVADRQAGPQPRASEGSGHGLHAEGQPESSLPGHDAVATGTAGGVGKADSVGESR